MRAALIVILLLAGPAVAQTSIADGDTLTLDGQRIRLYGIDAPEKKQTCRRGKEVWGCGTAATAALREMAAGGVTCEPMDRDRYNRTVAVCRAGELDLGAELVRRGLAVAYVAYSTRYLPEETEARKHRRGIWATEFTLPEIWRAAERRRVAVVPPDGDQRAGEPAK